MVGVLGAEISNVLVVLLRRLARTSCKLLLGKLPISLTVACIPLQKELLVL